MAAMPRGTQRTPGPVAIVGGKGGCGKTTTALGLALALVDRGHRPIVVDADVDVPDLHIRAGVNREPGLPAVAAGDRPVRVLQPSPAFPGVDVLAAGTVATTPPRALQHLDGLDRPVLVDCPAGAGPDASAPMRVANTAVLVTTTAPESQEDAAKSARMAEALDATPAVTVRVADQRIEPPASRGATGVPGATTGIACDCEISVPRVTGPPLASDRVRERYAAAAAELGW